MCIIMFVLLLCVGAAAAEDPIQTEVELFSEGGYPEMLYIQTYALEDARDSIVSQLKQGSTYIDISELGMSSDEFSLFYQDLLNSHPELFYVKGGGWLWPDENGNMVGFEPDYRYSGQDRENRIAAFEQSVANIANYASAATTDLGKLLMVNDYFCANFEYDTDYNIYRPDELFAQKKGVCQAYMLGYTAVLNQLGIANTYAVSDAMDHTGIWWSWTAAGIMSMLPGMIP